MLKIRVLLALALVVSQVGLSSAEAPLEKGFQDPPQEYGIRCWWWWLNGNVTKDAITRDLEAMKSKGFSGACIFDAGGAEQRGNAQVPVGPMFASPEWTELFKHAVTTADRLNLVLSLSIQSGWNLGGPDVTPAEATKCLVWSETEVTNGTPQILPRPKATDGFYKDIAVLAIPSRDAGSDNTTFRTSSAQPSYPGNFAFDGNPGTFWVSGSDTPGAGPTPAKPEWIRVDFKKPFVLGGVMVSGRPGYGPKDFELQVSTDGKEFKSVQRVTGSEQNAKVKCSPVEITAARLMITAAFDPSKPNAPRNVQISELAFLKADGSPVSARKSGVKVANLREKAVFHELGGSAPDTRFLLSDEPDQPGEADADLNEVLNLTAKLKPDGTLEWKPESGRWTVLRFGYTCTSAHVSTSSGQWQGRVIDYMSEKHFRAYWGRHVEPLLRSIGPLAGKTLTHLQTDSWELGGINWTDDFAAEFQRRRGYDVLPYLPIVAGKIIGNRETGTRFLADFRKTISDCISDNHYGTFAKLAREHGMGIQPESAGPHAGPFDGLKNYQHSEIMMSEFWVPSPHRPSPDQRFFVKQASSAAHIYNGRLVGAESFTSIGPHWNDVFWSSQRPSFDHEICSGLNLVLLHTFTCSPQEMGLPGQEYFAGTHFNPQVTWWSLSDGFISYLRRCQFMTQQGKYVADVLYYYGDHVPNIGKLKQHDPAGVLPGYDYDLINEDVLLHSLTVQDGRLMLPHGISYRVLVLPDHKVLSLDAARKVRQLVHGGATVLGPKVERTVSLISYPQSEAELKQISDELWTDSPKPAGQNKIGQGRTVWGCTARELLTSDKVEPDFQSINAKPGAVFDFIHYTIRGEDCYFICNQSAEAQQVEVALRSTNGIPELWDAVDGTRHEASSYRRANGLTTIPLRFEPYGSVFVLFRKGESSQPNGKSNYPTYKTLKQLEGPWDLRFERGRGAPAGITMEKLESWTENKDPGVKHFSGLGTYSTRFTLEKIPAKSRLILQLNDIRDVGMARVKLNGKDLGVVWAPPFRIDASDAIKKGENALEIIVANSWRNRLVGDRSLPAQERVTRTNVRIVPDWDLIPAGLLGPVEVVAASYD